MAQPVYGKHQINVDEFKARIDNEALARTLFYEDLDAGKIPHLSRDWTAAPLHVRQLYRSLALRVDRKAAKPVPPSFWARALTRLLHPIGVRS
jgi:hypothetical protein